MKPPLRISRIATLGLALALVTASEGFAFNPQPEPPMSHKSYGFIKAKPHIGEAMRSHNWTASQKLLLNSGGRNAFNPQPGSPKYNSAK